MTQMLLFDAPQTASFSVGTSRSVPEELVPPAETAVRQEEGGLQHMGDLARLVLLRYELMAKRRARRAERARQCR